MACYVIQFTSAARPGEDEVFNRWYDEVHVADVLAIPGFLSCQRYRVVDPAASRPRYVASYEVESDDPQATLRQLFDSGSKMVISPSLDTEQVTITILEPRLGKQKKA
jgi:hypothetical protein